MATNYVGTALIRIMPDMTRFTGAMNTGFRGATQRLAQQTRALSIGAGLVGAAMFKTAVDFDTSMQSLAAVVGTTRDGIGELEEAARRFGREGLFSATEAAGGMEELARAGLNTTQIIQGIPSVLRMAVAAQISVADSARIAATQLKVYGLEAAEVARVNDVLAKTDINTLTSMKEMGEALAYAAPVARTSRIRFEELNAALGSLADAGFRGSMGGTALRGAIARLEGPTGRGKKLLKELGIEVHDVDGRMRPLVDIVRQFEEAGLSTADAIELFGLRAGPGFLGIISQGSKRLAELTRENQLAGQEIETMSKMMSLSEMQTERLSQAFIGSFNAVSDLGFNIDETSAVLARFIKSGSTAEDASNTLTRALEAMRTEGFFKLLDSTIALDETSGKLIYTAKAGAEMEGQFVSLTEIIAALETRGLTTAGSLEVLGEKGADVAAIAGMSTEEILKLTEANRDAGTVSDYAATQMAGMQGSIKRLRGAFESLSISIMGSGILDGLADIADFLARNISHLSESNPLLMKFAAGFLVAATAIYPVLGLVNLLAAGMGKLVKLLMLPFANPLAAALIAIAVALGAMWTNSEKLRTSVGFFFRVLGHLFKSLFDGNKKVGDLSEKFAGLSEWGRKAGDALADLVDWVTAHLVPAFETAQPYVDDLIETFQNMMPVIAEFAKGVGTTLVNAGRALVPVLATVAVAIAGLIKAMRFISDVLSKIPGVVKVVGTLLGVWLVARLLHLRAAFSYLSAGSVPAFMNIIPRLAGRIDGLGRRLEGTGGALGRFGTRLRQAIPYDGEVMARRVFGGMVTAVATATAAMSGYMAGMANDFATQAASMVTSATSIAMAYAAAGPIGGALAAIGSVAGFVFGRIGRSAKEAKEEQERYNESVRSLAEAFERAGIDKYSTGTARLAVVTEDLMNKMKGSDETAERLNTAFDDLGVQFDDVAVAASLGEEGISSLNKIINDASRKQARIITDASLGGLADFNEMLDKTPTLAGEAQSAHNKLLEELVSSGKIAPEVADGLRRYGVTLQGITDAIDVHGGTTEDAADAQTRFFEILQQDISDSPSIDVLRDVPGIVASALKEQDRYAAIMAKVAEAERQRKGTTTQFADAFKDVASSIDTAADSYATWQNAISGRDNTLDQATVDIFNFTEQLLELKGQVQDENIAAQTRLLLSRATSDLSKFLTVFAEQSGGSFEKFKADVDAFLAPIITDLAERFNTTEDAVLGLLDQMGILATPDRFRVLLNTGEAMGSITELNNAIIAYIQRDNSNNLILETGTAQEKADLINRSIREYIGAHPTQVAELNIDDVTAKKSILDGVRVGLGLPVVMPVRVDVTPGDLNFFERALLSRREIGKGNVVGAWETLARMVAEGKIPANAEGSLVTGPIVSLVGEAGPELILPLSDPKRMQELLSMPQALPALEAAANVNPMADGAVVSGVAGSAAGDGEDASAAQVASWIGSMTKLTIDALKDYGQTVWSAVSPSFLFLQEQILGSFRAVTSFLAGWPAASWNAMNPGLSTFSASVSSAFSSLAMEVTTAWRMMFTDLASASTTGGDGVVTALSTALSAGTTEVARIVGDYAVALKESLDPILVALGEPKIALNVQASARGNINDPRIVPDGAYDVHVFGERGTHGEAYIPFNPTRRARSRAIAAEAVSRLGGVAYFAQGGVTGDIQGLHPEFLNRLRMWAQSRGQNFHVGSGYRSFQEQARLYAAYMAGVPGQAPAAPPGSSFHNYGLAADGPHWSRFNPGAFGLTYPMSYEPWHVQPFEAAAWRAMMRNSGMLPDSGWPMMQPIPDAPGAGARGVISDVASTLMGHARSVALQWATDQGMAIGAGAGSIDVSTLPVNTQRILATIRSLESGGNYAARNPYSSASGAYQFVRGTWGGYGGYPEAWMAPPSVQDARAVAHVNDILSRYAGALEAVPAAWYSGEYRGPGRLNYNPGGPGNPKSVQQYVNEWLARYASVPGFANGAVFDTPTVGLMGERGREVLLPLNRPARALELAVESGAMRVLDAERERVGALASAQPSGNAGFLGGGPGNTYHIYGVSMDQVRAEIRAHDAATRRVRL